MDSASTSDNVLDPELPVDYEVMPTDENDDGLFVPILSNYFSCNAICMGYLQNPGTKFGSDGIFCFSLIMFKIPNDMLEKRIVDLITTELESRKTIFEINDLEFKLLNTLGQPDTPATRLSALDYLTNMACNWIRTFPLRTIHYLTAQQIITSYIVRQPEKIVRYYFGEIEKDIDKNDNAKCGTCGAGVAYIGKVFSILESVKAQILKSAPRASPPSPSVPTVYSSNTSLFSSIQSQFNSLKIAGDLRQRIPIADARILKLFFQNAGIIITEEEINLLFKVLADYKRTGDYQQVYAVLFAILKTGTNSRNYTHATGDELAALFARMVGVPCIYQVSNVGRNTLYRNVRYMVNMEERTKQDLERKLMVIKTFYGEIRDNISTILLFLNMYSEKILQLKKTFKQFILEKPGTIMPDIDKLCLSSVWTKLNTMIILSNNLLNNFDSLLEFSTFVQQYFLDTNRNVITKVTGINGQIIPALPEHIEHGILLISKASLTPFSSLIGYIQENFPVLLTSNNASNSSMNILEPLTSEEIRTGTFNRALLNLFFVKFMNKDKGVQLFREYAVPPAPVSEASSSSSRRKTREVGKYMDEGLKQKTCQAFNRFVNNLYIQEPGGARVNDLIQLTVSRPDEIWIRINSIIPYLDGIINSNDIDLNIDEVKANYARLSAIINPPAGGNGVNFNSINYSLIQKGGSAQDINRKIIFMKVKKVVEQLLKKCNNYLSDISNPIIDIKWNTANKRIATVKKSPLELDNADSFMKIPETYDITEFCKWLLYNVTENTDDIGNEGILISLENIATEFTVDDIEGTADNSLLTVTSMLNKLGLYEIKFLMFMLSVNTIRANDVDMITDSEYTIDRSISDDLCREIDLNPNKFQYSYIYYNEFYSQLISIFCFTILYKIYNGNNSSTKNNFITNYTIQLKNNFSRNLGLRIPSNGLSSTPDEIFLRGVKTASRSTIQIASSNSADLPTLLNSVMNELVIFFNVKPPSSQPVSLSSPSSLSLSSPGSLSTPSLPLSPPSFPISPQGSLSSPKSWTSQLSSSSYGTRQADTVTPSMPSSNAYSKPYVPRGEPGAYSKLGKLGGDGVKKTRKHEKQKNKIRKTYKKNNKKYKNKSYKNKNKTYKNKTYKNKKYKNKKSKTL
jgi:hypothetical protein